ncbi:MAG: biotin--[acetyl-CoA-carboxylase] ligase [Marinibacterium sp.]
MSTDPGWPAGYDRLILDRVDSTLNEAARRAPELERSTWILAHAQTGARGRRGRPWQNPPGNLAATLVLRPAEMLQVAALRSFVAALALHDALARLGGAEADLALKWPNDVLLNSGKVSGILLESAGTGGRLDHLAIGIGVNLIVAPPPDAVEPGALRPVSVLEETGQRIPPEAFLDVLAGAYAAREAQFSAHGFEPIRTAWLARAAARGKPITARTAQNETKGTFDTVDAAGNLVLKTGAGTVHIPAADIYF